MRLQGDGELRNGARTLVEVFFSSFSSSSFFLILAPGHSRDIVDSKFLTVTEPCNETSLTLESHNVARRALEIWW